MKRFIMIFAAMGAVLSSCNKNGIEQISANYSKDIVLNISVSDPCTEVKSIIKNGWITDDEISIWFDTNTGINPDLVITYNGTKWIQKEGATVSGNAPSEGSGKYAKALYNGNVKVASTDAYTYADNTLTFSIANWKFLTEIQVVVTGPSLAGADAGSYTLACDKFTPCTGYSVGSDVITATTGTEAAAVTGISNTDGIVFVFATAEYTESSSDKKDFIFTLKDNTSSSEITKFYKPNVAIEAKEGKSTIKALTIESSKFFPEGALPGVFSVTATNKVHFSQGNMYYDGRAFKFEPNQYDFQSSWDANHVSHFFWSKTASVAYATYFSGLGDTESDVFFTNETEETVKTDFTVNGVTGMYRTLCAAEWDYMFNTRTMANGGIRYEKLMSSGISVEGVTFKGIVLFPDNFTDQDTWKTKYTTWEALNNAGLVFLPAAGFRRVSALNAVGECGYFWSSSAAGIYNASRLIFDSSIVSPVDWFDRSRGYSVRLIAPCH